MLLICYFKMWRVQYSLQMMTSTIAS